jgi:hypothetical protein
MPLLPRTNPQEKAAMGLVIVPMEIARPESASKRSFVPHTMIVQVRIFALKIHVASSDAKKIPSA